METIHITLSSPRRYSSCWSYKSKNWATCFYVGPSSPVRLSAPNIPTTSALQVGQQTPPSCRSKGNSSFPLPSPKLARGSPQSRGGGAGDTPGAIRLLLDELSCPTHTRWHCWFSLCACTLPPSPTLTLTGLKEGDFQPSSLSEYPRFSYLKSGPGQTFNRGRLLCRTCFSASFLAVTKAVPYIPTGL